MLYFRIELSESESDGELVKVVEISNKLPPAGATMARPIKGVEWVDGWISRHDLFDERGALFFGAESVDGKDGPGMILARLVAESAGKLMGKPFAAVDKGPSVWPRYDVIEAPKLGDEVSMAFNGDSYPVGKIVAIKPDLKRVVVDGERGRKIFIRRGESGAWLNKGWSLVCGSVFKLNPEF